MTSANKQISGKAGKTTGPRDKGTQRNGDQAGQGPKDSHGFRARIKEQHGGLEARYGRAHQKSCEYDGISYSTGQPPGIVLFRDPPLIAWRILMAIAVHICRAGGEAQP
jgi:hypothetical protein